MTNELDKQIQKSKFENEKQTIFELSNDWNIEHKYNRLTLEVDDNGKYAIPYYSKGKDKSKKLNTFDEVNEFIQNYQGE